MNSIFSLSMNFSSLNEVIRRLIARVPAHAIASQVVLSSGFGH